MWFFREGISNSGRAKPINVMIHQTATECQELDVDLVFPKVNGSFDSRQIRALL
jgi:hypothetical protein